MNALGHPGGWKRGEEESSSPNLGETIGKKEELFWGGGGKL